MLYLLVIVILSLYTELIIFDLILSVLYFSSLCFLLFRLVKISLSPLLYTFSSLYIYVLQLVTFLSLHYTLLIVFALNWYVADTIFSLSYTYSLTPGFVLLNTQRIAISPLFTMINPYRSTFAA